MRSLRFLLLAIAVVATLSSVASEHFSYIYSRNGQMTVMNGSTNLSMLSRMNGKWPSPYLWFELEGKSYVIRDAATMAEVGRLFSALDILKPQYEAIRGRLEPLEAEEQALDRREEALDDDIDELDDREDAASSARLRELQTKLREIERSMRSVEERMRVIEREEELLDRKQDAMEREAERQLLPMIRIAIKTGRAERL